MELTQILLKDNNQGHTQQYKRSDIAALFPYYGKTIEQLCNENASLLVWPLNKKDTDDDVEKEIVFDIVNTENPDDVRLRTYNVMGFIGINYLKIKIIKMLKASMTAITPRDFALLSRTRDTAMPNSQFPAIESIITSTNHGSPHA